MYVAQLSEEEAEHVSLVPARHVLEAAGRRTRLQRIARSWPSGEERWHPHAAVLESPGVVAVQRGWVGTDELPLAPMRRALAAVAGGRIWELHEGPRGGRMTCGPTLAPSPAPLSALGRSGLPATS
jgi:hypothetical protein